MPGQSILPRGVLVRQSVFLCLFTYADDHGLNCYLECYSDRLQQMYEHIAFELIDELHSLDFEVYEWRIVRHPKL